MSVPAATATAKRQSAWGITCGSRPTARAGGMWSRSRRSVAIPISIATATDSGPAPNTSRAPTPPAAVTVHASGRAKGRLAQGQTSACANISNAMTTSGGNRISLSPVTTASP